HHHLNQLTFTAGHRSFVGSSTIHGPGPLASTGFSWSLVGCNWESSTSHPPKITTTPARGAPCRLTDEALATDKWRYNHFKLARLNKWHRPASGSSDAGAISLALRRPTRLPSVVIAGQIFVWMDKAAVKLHVRAIQPHYSDRNAEMLLN
ncbi:jg599, partial [Pararge aegeria aegeria]